MNLKTAYEIYDSIIKHDAIKEEFEKFLEEVINKFYTNPNYLDISMSKHNEDFEMCLDEMKSNENFFNKHDIEKFEKEGWLYYYFDLDTETTEIIPVYQGKNGLVYLPSVFIFHWDEVDSETFDKWKEYINYFVE